MSVSGMPTSSAGVSFEPSQLQGAVSDQLNFFQDINVQVGYGFSLIFDENDGFGGVSLKPSFALDVSASTEEGGHIFYFDTKPPFYHYKAAD